MQDYGNRSSSLVLRPLLNVCADGKELVVENEEERFRFGNIDIDRALQLLNRIDGQRSREELADRETVQDRAFLECLTGIGLALERRDDRVLDGKEAARRLEAAFDIWNQRLFSHPLWVKLADGTASYQLVLGWVLETYHFIRGANARLPLAVSHCSPGRQRDILARHFAEEYDHDVFFMQSLAAFGIDQPDVRASAPLPGTHAVIDWMRAAARSDILGYAACSGLLESTGSDARAARQFYDTLEKNYAFAPGFVAPMRRHVELDEGFGHGTVMSDMLEAEGEIDLRRADVAARIAYGFVETLEWWFSDILAHYDREHVADVGCVRRYRAAQDDIGYTALGDSKPDAEGRRPLIGPAVSCREKGQDVGIEDLEERLTFHGSSAALLQRLLPLLDGSNSTKAIARALSVSETAIEAHLTPLLEAGLVLDTAAARRAGEADAFCHALGEEALFWNRSFFGHPFLRRLFSGEASPAEVLGWGAEFYHFISGANQYMAAGVAHCPAATPWLDELARHYVEECDHARLFLDGLAKCGLDARAVERAQPLPTTAALLNRLTEIAQSETAGYAAAFAFMRPIRDGQPLREDPALYSDLARRYPFAAGLFDAFAEHGEIDAQLGHGEAPIYGLVRQADGLDRRRREDVVRALRMTAESFVMFVDGIERFYRPSPVFFLRQPATVHGLPGAGDVEPQQR